MKGVPRLRRLAVDASFDQGAGAAGVGIATPGTGGTAFIFEVVLVDDVNLAEAAAVARGLAWLEQHDAPSGSSILTDSLEVVRAIMGAPRGRLVGCPLIAEVRETIVERGWLVGWEGRHGTKAAHRAARFALRAWLAGRGGTPTTNEKVRLVVAAAG